MTMPFGYDWQCNHCSNQIRTSGLWEFYRDALGLRHHYGHPAPVSQDAIKSGVKGLYGEWYCPECREVRNIVAIEFDSPKDGSFKANVAGLEGIDQKEYPAICDRCKTPLKSYLDKSDICPKCNKGYFIEYSRFMS
jgi:hypothetical protein